MAFKVLKFSIISFSEHLSLICMCIYHLGSGLFSCNFSMNLIVAIKSRSYRLLSFRISVDTWILFFVIQCINCTCATTLHILFSSQVERRKCLKTSRCFIMNWSQGMLVSEKNSVWIHGEILCHCEATILHLRWKSRNMHNLLDMQT